MSDCLLIGLYISIGSVALGAAFGWWMGKMNGAVRSDKRKEWEEGHDYHRTHCLVRAARGEHSQCICFPLSHSTHVHNLPAQSSDKTEIITLSTGPDCGYRPGHCPYECESICFKHGNKNA